MKMNVSLSFPHPSTFSKTQLVQPNSTTILFCFSSFPFHSVRRIPQLDKKRCRFVTCASSLQLPLLPFPIDQVNITFIVFLIWVLFFFHFWGVSHLSFLHLVYHVYSLYSNLFDTILLLVCSKNE